MLISQMMQSPAKPAVAQANNFTVSNPKIIRKNGLVGKVDLQMPSGMIIRGVKLLEHDGRNWVGFPEREWVKQDGSKQYEPIIEFHSKAIRDKFRDIVVPLAMEALLGTDAERLAAFQEGAGQ